MDTEQQIAALTKKVEYLSDRLEIQDCIHRYSRGLDRLDRELALSAFHHDPDCTDDRGIHVGTPAEFVEWVFGVIIPYRGTAHSITNTTVEIDGDVAHAESYITFHVWLNDDPEVTFGQARYLDRLERRHGRWGIVHREAVIDYRTRLENTGLHDVGANVELEGARGKEDRSYLRPLGLSEAGKRRLAERRAREATPAE